MRSDRASASTLILPAAAVRAGCAEAARCSIVQILPSRDISGAPRTSCAPIPMGGVAQFITAPATALVRLPDNVSFNAAARFGYFGTAYAAMRKIGVGPGQSLLVNGISGTLGLCAALIALAMGATKILGTGRNGALLDRVKTLAPERIATFALPGGPAAVHPSDSRTHWSHGRKQQPIAMGSTA